MIVGLDVVWCSARVNRGSACLSVYSGTKLIFVATFVQKVAGAIGALKTTSIFLHWLYGLRARKFDALAHEIFQKSASSPRAFKIYKFEILILR